MNKKYAILAGLIFGLGLLLVVQKVEVNHLPKLKKWKDDLTEITVKNNGTEILFSKNGNDWVVGADKFKCDKAVTDELVNSLRDMKISALISETANYNIYELEAAKGIQITAKKDGKVLRDFVIGKNSAGGQKQAYIKLAGKDKIYLVNGLSRTDFTKSVNDYRDKKIFDVPQDAIKEMAVTVGSQKLTLVKQEVEVIKTQAPAEGTAAPAKEEKVKENRWTIAEQSSLELDNYKVEALLASFERVRADGFSSLKKEDLKKVKGSIRVKAYDREITLDIFDKDAYGDYLCSSSESPYVFTIKEWQVNNLLKGSKDLKK